MSLVARVEWRSEGRARTRPGAVHVGGERRVVVVEESVVEGAMEAGGALTRIFVVRDEEGRRYRITERAGRVSTTLLMP